MFMLKIAFSYKSALVGAIVGASVGLGMIDLMVSVKFGITSSTVWMEWWQA